VNQVWAKKVKHFFPESKVKVSDHEETCLLIIQSEKQFPFHTFFYKGHKIELMRLIEYKLYRFLSKIIYYIQTMLVHTRLKVRLCKHVWMEYNDFKMFTRVLWRFTMKFAPLSRVFRCVNRGDTPETGWIHLQVDVQWVPFSLRSQAPHLG